MRKFSRMILAFSGLVSVSYAASAQSAGGGLLQGDPEAGKAKSAVCTACHGNDGNSVNPQWPKIAGQGQRYFVEQLKAFQQGPEGPRRGPNAAMMYPIAANLSEQDMADLAAYYSQQKVTLGVAGDELAAEGRAVYRGGGTDPASAACTGCHGPAGRGNPPAGYPALAGQHAEYVYNQLRAFRNGDRLGDPNGMMRELVRKMSDEDMRAVAEYVQGLY